VGFAIAQQIMAQQGGGVVKPVAGGPAGAAGIAVGAATMPELLGPAEVAKALGVAESDVLAVLESGELKGKKIGTTWRVPRAALDAYLAS
jgi:excisionase family DNA binding protein